MKDFWNQVRKTDGCWEWTGTRTKEGYGRVTVSKKRQSRAHRVAWEWTNGPIPEGLMVCHHCDNRICVRPDHLFVGTAWDNTQDCIRKGRDRRGVHPGALNGRARLTGEQVAEIRRAPYRQTKNQWAQQFGVSASTIQWVRKGSTWKPA